MELAVCIDWLSYTATQRGGSRYFITPPWESTFSAKPDVGRFGYRRASRFPSGLIVMFDGATDTMGSHYVYSGQALAALTIDKEDGGISIIDWHEANGHKCTRIDLAIDVFDDPSFLPQIRGMADNNEFSGTARSATIVSSSDGAGLTVYMGSRTSQRFVRIYNKAAQTGTDRPWVRIECEVKSDSARAVARAILGVGVGGISLVAKSVIQRVCSFPSPAWEKVFEGGTIPIGTPKIEERQTEAWLLGQVTSAIVKFERHYPEKRILERICQHVEMLLSE